jgi:uncharacterized cupin superfamily protein
MNHQRHRDSTSLTIRHVDEFPRDGGWRLARRALGVRAFGLNVVDVPPGGSLPAHTEQDPDQEEVYVVLSGSPTITVDGVVHPAPAGTFVRLDPAPLRAVHNPGPEPARLLMVSAPVSSGYEPMEWA